MKLEAIPEPSITVAWEQIPRELTIIPRWVVWKWEERNGKSTKPPYCARTGTLASTTDPTSWSTFSEALAALRDGLYAGIGLVVTTNDSLFGIDLDHCVDPDTGTVAPWAQDIVDQMQTYTEISPSGTGLRLWAFGTLPPGGRKKGLIEMYQTGRYLTVTGQRLGPRTPVQTRTNQVASLHAQVWPSVLNGNGSRPAQPVETDDSTLVDRMLHAANGSKVQALWNGDWSGYPSQSEGDSALCFHLAFWCGHDAARMDRLFRRSGLFRPKWDEQHGAQTYGAMTLARACAACTASLLPAPPADRADDARTNTPDGNTSTESMPKPLLGQGLGAFLSFDLPQSHPLVQGVFSNDGGGWISGEEKLKKSFYALAEALGLALGLPVCGRFAVPVRKRVMFIEEEDSPGRTQRRLQALLRGYGLNPDDPDVRADLDAWFQISVWSGFTLDAEAQIEQLRQTLAKFQPTVVYLDVLRKLTTRDLNKADQAGALLKVLDDLRREYGVLFRVLHHNRKIQGSYRAGRGSQELSGSYQLGAWGENSLFFEPIGKTQGAVKVVIQCKDGAPLPAFGLRIEAEGPPHAPTLIRLHAEVLNQVSAAEALKEQVFEAVSRLPLEAAKSGHPGVSREAMCKSVNRSSYPVRTAVQILVDEGRLEEVGKTSKQKKLYQVKAQ